MRYINYVAHFLIKYDVVKGVFDITNGIKKLLINYICI